MVREYRTPYCLVPSRRKRRAEISNLVRKIVLCQSEFIIFTFNRRKTLMQEFGARRFELISNGNVV